jgi:photosystem II stability/assembly factor-like uncharacterized protein
MQAHAQGTTMYVATDHGISVYERPAERWVQTLGGLDQHHVTSVAASRGEVLVGTREGVYRSIDGGASWWPFDEGMVERHVRWIAYLAVPDGHSPLPNGAVVGTEPAAIYVTTGAEQGWRRCEEVATLRDRLGWYLPYSPEAGCVRGFAFHGARGYAAVEQGGLLRSDDGGERWQLVAGSDGVPRMPESPTMIHPDVHSVAVHPSSPGKVVAATGGGLYASSDGGARWRQLYRCYCRAVWVDPHNAEHIVLGPADGVSRNGRIERSFDGGETWQPGMDGSDTVWPRRMVERFTQVGDELLAVLSDGELIAAPLHTLKWRVILPSIQRVNAIAAIQSD